MAGLRGNQAAWAFAKQSGGKEFPNNDYLAQVPFTDGNIQPSREVGNLSETDANRDQGVAFVQTTGVEGAPGTYVRDSCIHHLLEYALGSRSRSDVAAPDYTHTITPANALPYVEFYKTLGGTLFERYLDCKVSELTISAEAGQPLTVSLDLLGREAKRLTAAPSDVAEVQTVTVTGTPTGGDYKLGFGDQTTGVITYNSSAADVQTALRALSNISATGVSVTGSAGGPYTVTFANEYATVDVPLITLDDNDLTGGTAPSVTIVETTPGSAALPTLNSTTPLNYNDATVTLGGTSTRLVGGFELAINNNVTAQQTDDSIPYDVVEGLREVTLGFQLIFEDLAEYNKFHYGGASGTAQSRTLAETSATFLLEIDANNSLSLSLPHLAYQELSPEPDPGGDPIVVDVAAVAQRHATDPVVTAVVENQNAD